MRFIVVFLFWVLVIYGYVANVYRFCILNFEPAYKAEVLRGIGVFIPPFGVIMGFIDISDPEPASK